VGTVFGYWVRASRRVAFRPRLWPVAVVQTWRFVPRGWWRRPPFLPLPAREYLRFRLRTQYGAAGEPDPSDVVTYLEWCRQLDRNRPWPRERHR
jgi:hypothetical protein